ncbi:DUF6177 family protein [Streptomyces sp. NPDC017529]|uniref:DUF6177 family protein n=1 Tax=Streptomyces sp. NPDC017529 TaxID=3365000 RepID=UPI0037AD2E9F
MTTDVIALTRRMPDVWSLAAGMMAGGPEAHVSSHADGAVLRLADAEGRPLASVEAPVLVHTPGEAARLLGPSGAVPGAGPLWWTEVRAATGARGGDRLAGVIASRLVAQLGGAVWPRSAAVDAYGETVTDVVPTAGQATEHPAVDVLTGKAAVVVQDRPVICLTAWLSDAFRAAASGERALQIVTPPGARLTLPVRTALTGIPNRWVVQDGEGGYYDGLSGSELRWQPGADGHFAATGNLVPAFVRGTPAEQADGTDGTRAAATAGAEGAEDDGYTPGRQLVLSLRVRHAADRDLVLGGALEDVWQHVTGAPPAGWGTAEPAALRWSRHELTDFARERAPEPTWLVVVGHPDRPGIATLRVSRTGEGVEEDVTAAFGFPYDADLPIGGLPELSARLVTRHGLVTSLVQQRVARTDLSVPARFEVPAQPLAFVLGSAEVREIGITHARRPPLPEAPRQLGPMAAAGFHYPLGEGGWEALEGLIGYLRPDRANRTRGTHQAGGA